MKDRTLIITDENIVLAKQKYPEIQERDSKSLLPDIKRIIIDFSVMPPKIAVLEWTMNKPDTIITIPNHEIARIYRELNMNIPLKYLWVEFFSTFKPLKLHFTDRMQETVHTWIQRKDKKLIRCLSRSPWESVSQDGNILSY